VVDIEEPRVEAAVGFLDVKRQFRERAVIFLV
jgi:hypothetical protein